MTKFVCDQEAGTSVAEQEMGRPGRFTTVDQYGETALSLWDEERFPKPRLDLDMRVAHADSSGSAERSKMVTG
jgi:hypothetical protein